MFWDLGRYIFKVKCYRLIILILLLSLWWCISQSHHCTTPNSRVKLACMSRIAHAHFTLSRPSILSSHLFQVEPLACGRTQNQEFLKQVLSIVHAASYKDLVVAKGHSEVLSANDWSLIVCLTPDSVPAHALWIELLHVRGTNFHTRIDPLQGHHAREEVQLVVITFRVLDINWTWANCLDNRSLVLDLRPGAQGDIDLVDFKLELTCDHWRTTKQVQDKLPVFKSWHKSWIFSRDWLAGTIEQKFGPESRFNAFVRHDSS